MDSCGSQDDAEDAVMNRKPNDHKRPQKGRSRLLVGDGMKRLMMRG